MPKENLNSIAAPNAESLKPFAGSVGNLKSLEGMAGAAKSASIKYYQALARLNLAGQKKKQDFARALQGTGVSPKEADKLIAQNAAAVRKELVAASAKERATIFGPLLKAKESVAYMKRDGIHPKNIATAFRVTDPARAALWAQVDAMAAGSLAALARQVTSEPNTDYNRMLAACLILKNDTFEPNARSFNSFELADICFKKESDSARQLISSIEQEAESVQAINTAWESSKPIPPNLKIQLGLAYPEINISHAVEGDDPEQTQEALSALQKIAGGLANTSDKSDKFGNLMNSLQKSRSKSEEEFDAAIAAEMAKLDALAAA